MIRYSCDRCKRMIDPELDPRYVVKIEVHATMEPFETNELDDDRDHLIEIQEILAAIEEDSTEAACESVFQRRSFDLCPECYRKFSKNPVGRDMPAQIDFSKN